MRIAHLLGIFALLAAPPGQDQGQEKKEAPKDAIVGERVPNLSFKTVLGGDGRDKLSEFRGQPVILAWYSRVFAGIEAAKLAARLEEEHGSDRVVAFLMEIKGNDTKYMRALQMADLPGATSRLIPNKNLYVVFDDSTGPPPKIVVVGVDGTLRYAGSYGKPSEVKKLVKEELERAETGWGEDEIARKARALAFGKKGELGAALTMLGESPEGERREAASEITWRFAGRKRSVGHHLEQGEPAQAAAAEQELVRAAKGHPPWEAEAATVAAAVEGETFAHESELEIQLEKILAPLKKKEPKKPIDVKLREFATKAYGTKVGERASRLVEAAAFAMNDLK